MFLRVLCGCYLAPALALLCGLCFLGVLCGSSWLCLEGAVSANRQPPSRPLRPLRLPAVLVVALLRFSSVASWLIFDFPHLPSVDSFPLC